MNFDDSLSKMSEPVRRIANRAVEIARRLSHGSLENEHIFLSFAQIEWDLFSELVMSVGINPHTMVGQIEEILDKIDKVKLFSFQDPKLSPDLKLTLKLMVSFAGRDSRQTAEIRDLFAALVEDSQSSLAHLIRRFGVQPSDISIKAHAIFKERDSKEEILKTKFELPTFLKLYGVNLNFLARQDKIPPVFFRDKEIQLVMEALCHRERPNSAILIGEPGVGKTAIGDGLARKIEFEPGSVPMRLRECQIVKLTMNTLVAGTTLRGSFEERIGNVVRELKEHPNIILFIDEAHTIIGAGSALGAPSDAADVFKSGMANGEIRIIASTTLSEYRQHIQQDEAFERRFRTILVREPTISEARDILYKVRDRLQRNYSVEILDEAIEMALLLAPRYMRHFHLPDKIISWLDTASVRAEMNRSAIVRAADIVPVISDVARIPINMVSRNVIGEFKNMDVRLSQRVIGQKAAIEAVTNRLILNKGPLKDGWDRPDGVFLFLGPTGVGKTELAKALAEFLFGDDKKMIRIDMSEYQDPITAIDKLIGMPRGIVGSDRGGVLTNQLKDEPYSIVLLDEIEKADPSVLNLFLAAFDEGWLTSGQGKRVYLSDCIIIMTSNLGSHLFRRLTSPLGFLSGEMRHDQIEKDIKKELAKRFSPEFRNRIEDVAIFSPLTHDQVRQIAENYLAEIKLKILGLGKTLEIDDAAVEQIVQDGHSLEFGARFLKRLIDQMIKIPISGRLDDSSKFHVLVKDGKIVVETKNGTVIKSIDQAYC